LSPSIDARTKLCAVIGDPVEHSLSPAVHNAAFAALNLPYVYVAFRVRDVAAAVAGIRGLGLAGASVTIPHKTAIIPYLDELDGQARRVGSVNTVVNRNGRLLGYTTDGAGALRAMDAAGVPVKSSRVALVGTGGAARAVAFALLSAGCGPVTLVGVERDQMAALAGDLAEAGGSIKAVAAGGADAERAIAAADLIVNCSPVGMHPDVNETPVPARLMHEGQSAFDAVYNPMETRFLREARGAGCRAVSGVEMFVGQAAAQFELWTGREAPVGVMREVVVEALRG